MEKRMSVFYDDSAAPAVGAPRVDAQCHPQKGVELINRVIGSTTLVAIAPDARGARGFWLDTTTLVQAGAWATERSEAGGNIYFQLNEPRFGLARKGGRTDVVALRGFGADVDAKNGRSMEEGLAAIDAVQLPPSLVIMSGGGWQPLWLFDAPIPATPDNVEHVETMGRWLAKLTGGDPVQNVDRLFRLPFTINYPNSKKRAEGRTPCAAGILLPGDGR
jgi:hypothetical protein